MKIFWMTTWRERFWGLMGRPYVSLEEGFYFPSCRAVHSFFMKIPITVIFCDKQGKICKIKRLEPWSVSACWKASGVFEFSDHPKRSQEEWQRLLDDFIMTSIP